MNWQHIIPGGRWAVRRHRQRHVHHPGAQFAGQLLGALLRVWHRHRCEYRAHARIRQRRGLQPRRRDLRRPAEHHCGGAGQAGVPEAMLLSDTDAEVVDAVTSGDVQAVAADQILVCARDQRAPERSASALRHPVRSASPSDCDAQERLGCAELPGQLGSALPSQRVVGATLALLVRDSRLGGLGGLRLGSTGVCGVLRRDCLGVRGTALRRARAGRRRSGGDPWSEGFPPSLLQPPIQPALFPAAAKSCT